ncbi:MAG TPA: hypothetical protein VLJ42_00685 [Solirubrobacteraceae bacterium]|nr:hypothetical protein [Solirubrobacteraceae bacterium]
MKLPGALTWCWLGFRTRRAACAEAVSEQPFVALGSDGMIRPRPACYQRLLLARLERYLETLEVEGAGILVNARIAYTNKHRELGEINRRLLEARRWVPTGQEPAGWTSIWLPRLVAASLAFPLTWPFVKSMHLGLLSNLMLVSGLVVIEVFVAERAGSARGALLYNELGTPMALSAKEALDARQRLVIFGSLELTLVIALAVARSEPGPFLLWLALGTASAVLGVFAGVVGERGAPWKRVRRLERAQSRVWEEFVDAHGNCELATRRIASLTITLITRVGELNDSATDAFTRRWHRRHAGIVPQPPRLRLPDEEKTIQRMLTPMREVVFVRELGVNPCAGTAPTELAAVA